ncbi:universal stress protein [Neomegalonema perideroedes]|uniref:universal stress protein n=1 Tax=Neomegalonema perideroedes TaxID=217219 RepID=UPI00036B7935|nr:universal stress protein [Neomegalonema perideroedes]
MTQETFVVAYEGGADSDRVLSYAISRAQRGGAKLVLAHILEWSPYAFLTQEELAERHARRKKEMARAQEAILAPAVEKVRAAGLEAQAELRYGSVPELIVDIAKETNAALIFVGRAGSSSIAARIFGSVPLALAQIAPVPTVIVP